MVVSGSRIISKSPFGGKCFWLVFCKSLAQQNWNWDLANLSISLCTLGDPLSCSYPVAVSLKAFTKPELPEDYLNQQKQIICGWLVGWLVGWLIESNYLDEGWWSPTKMVHPKNLYPSKIAILRTYRSLPKNRFIHLHWNVPADS